MNSRKTYNRRADIPPALLRALNHGRENPITLSEWLAIDAWTLARSVLPELGLQGAAGALRKACKDSRGTVERMRLMGCAFHNAL
jgi:hypothetical protein